jgi:protein phosphatase
MVHEDQIHKILLERDSLASAAQQLIDAANEGGGRDNISVILFRLGSDEDTIISGTAQLDD